MSRRLSRRQLLSLAGVAAGLVPAARARAAAPALTFERFDLSQPSYPLHVDTKDKPFKLADGTVMQSFAFDRNNGQIFAIQVAGAAGSEGILYTLEGNAWCDGTNSPCADKTLIPDGNTYLTSLDLTTGAVLQRHISKVATSLTYREPEGMAINGLGDDTVLCFGFASGATGDRRANIYYKDGVTPA